MRLSQKVLAQQPGLAVQMFTGEKHVAVRHDPNRGDGQNVC